MNTKSCFKCVLVVIDIFQIFDNIGGFFFGEMDVLPILSGTFDETTLAFILENSLVSSQWS